MTFLKKLGGIIAKGLSIVTGFGPILSTTIPGTRDDLFINKAAADLAQIADLIALAEVFGQVQGLAGPDKLKAVTPAVAQIILKSSVLVGKKIKDEAKFASGATKIADGMADVLNSLDEGDVKEESKA